MKLSKRTIDILKNFSNFSPSLVFEKGNWIATNTFTHSVLAAAKIEETFPLTFGIYDLKKFLSVISLLKEPDFEFGLSSVLMTYGTKKIDYRYADLSLFQSREKWNPYEKKDKVLTSIEIIFELSYEDYENIKKASETLSLPDLAINGNGENIILDVLDIENPLSDHYTINTGQTNQKFNIIFRNENIKLIQSNSGYHVDIASLGSGIAKFECEDVRYFVAVERNSTFKG